MAKLNDIELEGVSGGTGNPCVVTGPYWGNAMRTDGPYNAICWQNGITAEYVATEGNNCKYRLWRGNTAMGWTDITSLRF